MIDGDFYYSNKHNTGKDKSQLYLSDPINFTHNLYQLCDDGNAVLWRSQLSKKLRVRGRGYAKMHYKGWCSELQKIKNDMVFSKIKLIKNSRELCLLEDDACISVILEKRRLRIDEN